MQFFIGFLITLGILFIIFPALVGILLGAFFIFIGISIFLFIKGYKNGFKEEDDFVQLGKYKIYKNNKK